MPAAIDVSVIVPAYNEVRSIGATLDDVLAYFDGKGMRAEVVVVVDGDDGTAELVAERARLDPHRRFAQRHYCRRIATRGQRCGH